MNTLKFEDSTNHWKRWLLWNTLGVFVAIGAMAEIPEFMYGFIRSGTHLDVSGYSNAPIVTLSAVLSGWTIAISQLYILRRIIGRNSRWVIVTILGFGISILVVWMFSGRAISSSYADHAIPHAIDNAGIMGGILIGGVLGVSQWFILRRYFIRSYLWIIANLIGVTVGWELARLQPTSEQIAHFAGALVIGIAWSITTGIALRLMIHGQNSHTNWDECS